ncbi:unnamed protein product [Camellia sinensis]
MHKVFNSSTTHNQLFVSGLAKKMKIAYTFQIYADCATGKINIEVIDAFAEMKLALQPSIKEFEKHDLAFARNPYAGRSYVFSILINKK